jgi:hypothetical protein
MIIRTTRNAIQIFFTNVLQRALENTVQFRAQTMSYMYHVLWSYRCAMFLLTINVLEIGTKDI